MPLLIHMYFWYMALAFLRLPPFACAVLGLAIYSGAYMAETSAPAFASVPQGQRRAALATGLTPLQALFLVVYPQALRHRRALAREPLVAARSRIPRSPR